MMWDRMLVVTVGLACAVGCGPSPEYQNSTIRVVAQPAPGAVPVAQQVATYDSPGPSTPVAPQPGAPYSSQNSQGQPIAPLQPQPQPQPRTYGQPVAPRPAPSVGQPVAPPQRPTYAQPVSPPAVPPYPHPPTAVAPAAPVPPPASAACNNSCARARDGVCDDGRRGANDHCQAGSDCDDCGAYARGAEINAGCTNTCRHAGDGECDDGRRGAESDLCSLGTDCQDCGAAGRP